MINELLDRMRSGLDALEIQAAQPELDKEAISLTIEALNEYITEISVRRNEVPHSKLDEINDLIVRVASVYDKLSR